jgi:hypothetical protein
VFKTSSQQSSALRYSPTPNRIGEGSVKGPRG